MEAAVILLKLYGIAWAVVPASLWFFFRRV